MTSPRRRSSPILRRSWRSRSRSSSVVAGVSPASSSIEIDPSLAVKRFHDQRSATAARPDSHRTATLFRNVRDMESKDYSVTSVGAVSVREIWAACLTGFQYRRGSLRHHAGSHPSVCSWRWRFFAFSMDRWLETGDLERAKSSRNLLAARIFRPHPAKR